MYAFVLRRGGLRGHLLPDPGEEAARRGASTLHCTASCWMWNPTSSHQPTARRTKHKERGNGTRTTDETRYQKR